MELNVNMYIREKTLFIRLKGELDEHTSQQLKQKMVEIIEKYNIENLVFNMNKLTFMDSSGIGLILNRYNHLKNKNGKILLVEMNEIVKKIVKLSGLERITTIIETEEKAKWFLNLI